MCLLQLLQSNSILYVHKKKCKQISTEFYLSEEIKKKTEEQVLVTNETKKVEVDEHESEKADVALP